jgi:hypothetical protein
MPHHRAISSGATSAEAHELVDPKHINKAGRQVRECLDSDEHPNTTPIVVAFDLTGSNAHVADLSQEKLKTLFGVVQRRGVVEDPSIAVAGYGDAYCDIVPLQISQFEASNALDAALDSFYLEKGGGGNDGETATLLWYFLNNYTELDSLKKRGKKGFFFMIADEKPLPLKVTQLEKFLGTEEHLIQSAAEEITVKALAEGLLQRFDVTVLLVENRSAREQRSKEVYSELFGTENVVTLDRPDDMVEVIATILGFKEETLSLDEAQDVLIDSGASRESASRAVAVASHLYKGGSRTVPVTAPDLGL